MWVFILFNWTINDNLFSVFAEFCRSIIDNEGKFEDIWAVITLFIFLTFAAFGTNVGSHRYFTHRSFKANKKLRFLLIVLQTMAGWVYDKHLTFPDCMLKRIFHVIFTANKRSSGESQDMLILIPEHTSSSHLCFHTISDGWETTVCIISVSIPTQIHTRLHAVSSSVTSDGYLFTNIQMLSNKATPLIWAIWRMIRFWCFKWSEIKCFAVLLDLFNFFNFLF